MSRKQQRQFVKELIRNVQADLLSIVDRVPEEWDGHELRQWIADRFDAASFTLDGMKARKRAYKNAIITLNLS